MNSPFFSIVVPVFNAAKTISICLDSIVNQTFKEFEILIVDGLSTDYTLEKIHQYQTKSGNITVVSEADKGIYDAMNKGILLSKGEWIYFLGSDDYLKDENVLSNVMLLGDLDNCDFVYGNVNSPEYGENYDGEFDINKILNQNICHQAIFVRKALFRKFGMLNKRYELQADYDFNLKCLFDKSVRKKYIDLIIAWYAPGGSSATSPDKNFEKDKMGLLLKYGWKVLSGRQLYQLSRKMITDFFSSRFSHE